MKNNKSAVLEALRNAAVNESLSVAFLEEQRWGTSPACPLCGAMEVYKMIGRDEQRNKDYRWRCNGCKKMFTVRTRTIFEETRLPLRVWVYAFWKACSSKKGISALQLSREMEITHKSALFVLRRIRHGVGEENRPKLTGTLEADELYVGGKPRFQWTSKRGRGSKKIPVLGIVQRGGDVRFHAMKRLTSEKLGKFIAQNAELTSRLMTDEANFYTKVGRKFQGGHKTVRHHCRQYVRPGTDIHSNTIEGVFSLIRRGVMGTFHSISTKHLPNYLNEFEFRWNTRYMDDGERVTQAIKAVGGKRLLYRESVENPPYAISTST
jgi:transposase-like protein